MQRPLTSINPEGQTQFVPSNILWPGQLAQRPSIKKNPLSSHLTHSLLALKPNPDAHTHYPFDKTWLVEHPEHSCVCGLGF